MAQPARTLTEPLPGVGAPDDLPAPANGIESHIDRLSRDIAEHTALIKELVRQSDTELALPALNRRAFMREASRLCLLARRHQFPLALLHVNIDDFRHLNEAYGRRGGDAVLEQLALHLERLVRGSDLMGRVGADEFCALLSHTGRDAAAAKGSRLAELLREEPPVYLGRPVDTHLTFGAVDVAGRMIDAAMDEAVSEILGQRQHRLP
jgi:diguanylate cyclase (GGDEF)-like protein